MDEKRHSRRHVLKRGLVSGATAFAAPYVVPRHILGGAGFVAANDRVQIGVIGCGVRGKYLVANMPDAGRVVALCDCYLPNVENTRHPTGTFVEPLAAFREGDARNCATHQDYRQLLDAGGMDAVMIATPDHHHVPAGIRACQAGLDVYLEKPLTLTIAEGRALVHAVRNSERVLQVGSQQRTMEINRRGCELVRSGGLGRISRVELRNLPGPLPAPDLPGTPIPDGLDWELFCGPTTTRPHHRDLWVKDAYKFGYLTWRGWDLWREFSGHLMTNWGGHSVDMAQMALGTEHTGPVRIEPDLSDLDAHIDDAWHEKTPPLGTHADRTIDRRRFRPVTMTYANGVELAFSPGVRQATFHGERGQLRMSRNRFQTDPPELSPTDIDPGELERWQGDGHVARPHIENWLECIKTRGTPNAPVEAGHRTATICHLANIARALERPLAWNPEQERFVDDAEANGMLDRERRPGFELPVI